MVSKSETLVGPIYLMAYVGITLDKSWHNIMHIVLLEYLGITL